MVIIAAMSISLVTYFNPSSRNRLGSGGGGGSGDYSADFGSINGVAVTRDQFFAAEREGRLFFFLRSGQWPDSEDQKKQVEGYAEQCLLLDAEMKEFKINVTLDAAARFTKEIMGVPQDQAMPQDKLNEFVINQLGKRGGLTFDDFYRFIRHQCGQEYLSAIVGMSGKLITSKEAEFFYRRENEPMVAQWVNFPATNYYAQTAPTDAELSDYFTKHQADYRLPDRIQVNYIQFEGSNYFAQADKVLGTNLEDRADQYYHQQGAEAFHDADGKTLAADEAMARIKNQMRMGQALIEAKKEANSVLADLLEGHDDEHPYSAGDLAAVAKTRNLTVKTTAPFDEKTGSKELEVPANLRRSLFAMREDDPDDKSRSMLYASTAFVGESSVYVVGLQKRMPSQLQALSVIYDKVVADYRRDKAVELAHAAGDKFASAVQAGMAQPQDKTFEAVCSAENVKSVELPPFALTSTNPPPQIPDRSRFEQLQEVAFRLPADEASPFVPTAEGGFVVYVRERLPVDSAKMQREMPDFLARMREQRQIAAFQQWLERELQLRLVPAASLRSNPVG